MAPKTELVFRALVGGSTGAGVVTTLGLAVWSSSNASWAISNFALSALALMGVSSIACFVGASTAGLAWHRWMQSRGWTNAQLYWAPAAIAGALIPILIFGPSLIANHGTDTVTASLTSILSGWGAVLGGLTGLFAWIIRRPDRDVANPATAAP